ncbi:D-aminoacyl-tRNA deacylase [Pedobacter sp. L105]|uniref:D-aminoacyl-tRNA deacylase n=1 Tax=Pedobacter sp. L105 TaxID=1641871 RepID=UPI00131E33C1|nr:D-aminoacyl-tRNA deacylase [Pedobacter sp. L105]
MRAVLQRVTEASCKVDGQLTGEIEGGLMILLGIEDTDGQEDVEWLAAKLVNMRIFGDEQGLMNRSLTDTGGNILLISQFTLYAATKKGNRPGFTRAARPEKAIPLYEAMIRQLEVLLNKPVQMGIFGADMKISLVNDGPVTIIIDTKNKE